MAEESTVDRILSAGNESYTGEDIREHLEKAGYIVAPAYARAVWRATSVTAHEKREG